MDDLVIYTTTQTHSLGTKAALVFGLSLRVLEVSVTDDFGLRGQAFRNALEEDLSNGLKPFVLSKSIIDYFRTKFD